MSKTAEIEAGLLRSIQCCPVPPPTGCGVRLPADRLAGERKKFNDLSVDLLRAIVDFKALGERTIWIDCDVIQADGGTRTASITGAFIALWDACQWLMDQKLIKTIPIIEHVAATSVGIINGTPMLDLCYTEDSSAEVDMNVVMTGAGKFVEIQGTAEETPFSKEESDQMLDLAIGGIEQLIRLQKQIIIENRDEVSIGNPESG